MEVFRRIAASRNAVTMRAFGSTTYELVEHASMAMFSVGRDLGVIAPTHSRPLVAPGDSYIELMRNWFDELLLLGDEEDLAWSQATVDRLEEGGIQGSAAGLYRGDVMAQGPVVQRVGDIGSVVEIPDGLWVDLLFETGPRLRVV